MTQSIDITDVQRRLIRHALGLDGRNKTTYRNHFVTGEGSDDHDDWMDLVNKGYALRRNGSEISGGDDVFWVTRETARAVLANNEHLSRDFR